MRRQIAGAALCLGVAGSALVVARRWPGLPPRRRGRAGVHGRDDRRGGGARTTPSRCSPPASPAGRRSDLDRSRGHARAARPRRGAAPAHRHGPRPRRGAARPADRRPPRPVRRRLHRPVPPRLRRPRVPALGRPHPGRPAEPPVGHPQPGVLGSVWRTEVGQMGFRRTARRPRPRRQPQARRLPRGARRPGLYGYCAPEPSGADRRAPGYCVLDDDFARSQFGRRPIQTLRVTAAHEFLHAVQFGYDYREDPWLLEATATWIEERYADGIDDNRQYLDAGPGRRAGASRSTAGPASAEYGNWAFFEYLAQQLRRRDRPPGLGAGRRGARRRRRVLGPGARSGRCRRGVVPESVFARYAMALSTPAASFPEGSAWGPATFVDGDTLGPDDTRDSSRSLDHLSSKASRWVPGGRLDTTDWQLRVSIDGPASAAAPVAGVVRERPDGTTDAQRGPARRRRRRPGHGAVQPGRRPTPSTSSWATRRPATAATAVGCGRATGCRATTAARLRLSLAVVRP